MNNANDSAPGYICFSAQDWWYHNRAHSDIQLMRRVAERRKVLFVNSITMRMPLPGRSAKVGRRLLRKAQSMARSLRRPVPGLDDFWVFTPVLLPFYGSPFWRGINARLIRRQVGWAARRIGIREQVFVVTVPTAWEVVRPVARRALVYNRSDKHSSFVEADLTYITRMEQELLAGADHVLYVSRALMADDHAAVRTRATFLDHGVDLEHFTRRSPEEEPEDLRTIPHPRIGYFGGLDSYLVDFDLLHRLADELPDAQLVLVGDADISMRGLRELPNVHWLGFKDYEKIPCYGSGFDVGIMPWLRSEWIAYSNPIKLKEYLALGLPIVTTDFAEAHHYPGLLEVVEDHDDFVDRVRQILAAGPDTESARARRRAAVTGAGWDRRADELIALCEPEAAPATPAAGPALDP